MTITTTFQPQTPTYLIGATATQVGSPDLGSAICTYRVRCLVAAYLTWGSTASITAAGAPIAGTPSPNTLGMIVGTVMYVQLPPRCFMIASAAAAFEVTGGDGGSGGAF